MRKSTAEQRRKEKILRSKRHLRDPQFPDRALCGREVYYPEDNFRSAPLSRLCSVCRDTRNDAQNFAENFPLARAKKATQPRNNRERSAAERRRLLVRPAGLHVGSIDIEEMRRFPSVKPAGGGWQA